jgi:acyl carrier protein
MQNEEIYRALNEVFQDVFDDDSIRLTSATVADDVPGWNSLTHISLIVATEGKLGIKFKTAEIEGLKNVGHFVEVISSHLRER